MEAHQQQQSKPRRVTLAGVTSERRLSPVRVLIYGPGGVGKTTFAAGAASAIILGAEDGADYKTVARFPTADTWQDVLDGIAELRDNDHKFKSLGLDSIDWIEKLIINHVCAKGKKESLEAFGYGAGYALVFDQMRAFIALLDRLRREKGMAIVAIAHSAVKLFNNPEGENFDRYELKLQAAKNANVSDLWKEWPDYHLFANFETLTSDSKKSGVKGESTGERYIYTQRTAAYDAKSRLSLPEKLPLNWGAFARAVKEAFEKEGKEQANGTA